MGTRCIIKVEGLKGVCVYKHWDGYPKGTLPWLKDFNKKFTEERGFDDPEYKFAQLLRSSAFDCKKFNLGKDNTHRALERKENAITKPRRHIGFL